MEDLELGVLHPMQQHVHSRQVVGGDVILLPVDSADRATGLSHLLAHIQQQGTRATGEVHHLLQPILGAGAGILAIEGNNAGKDVGDLLRGVELSSFLAGTSRKLSDQVFIGIA
jgi:hypothetical protein